MFKRESETLFQFNLHFKLKEAHDRIIWALSWSHDDRFYVTGSRKTKKSVKVWSGFDSASLHGELAVDKEASCTSV